MHFFGIDQQYFLSALYPLEGAMQGRCSFVATPEARAVIASFPLTVAAGQTVTYRFGGYLGPKEPDLLAAVPGQALREAAGIPPPPTTRSSPRRSTTASGPSSPSCWSPS